MQTSQDHVPSPITCRIHADHGVFVTTWRRAVSDDDHIRFYLDLFETPDWRPGLHEIVDLRLADMAGVTPGGLRRLWGHRRKPLRRPRHRVQDRRDLRQRPLVRARQALPDGQRPVAAIGASLPDPRPCPRVGGGATRPARMRRGLHPPRQSRKLPHLLVKAVSQRPPPICS